MCLTNASGALFNIFLKFKRNREKLIDGLDMKIDEIENFF
jgi:hypothetical protein